VTASWEVVVGIETHAQLQTKSKMFSGASTAFGAPPNTQASAVDIALPGTLPVANRAAVEHAIRFGLAVKGTINRRSIFARKNYFYPDLPKGYQISQYETPIVQGGEIRFLVGDQEKIVRLTRAHLEEDAGKSLHEDFHGMTGIDLNRAGTPLLEIVSEPELRGAKEAVAYARALHALVMWIGICDGNMQEGSFRCDANVSVRRIGDKKLGTRCEIKNLNSFRFMERAIEFEARRQVDLLEDGKSVVQETRLYDPERDETRSMRTKEDAQDYRYFPDPDLLPLVLKEEDIDRTRSSLPELPDAKRERFTREYRLPAYDATLVTASRAAADYFEELVRVSGADPKICANWQAGELAAELNRRNIDISTSPMSAEILGSIIKRIVDGTLSGNTAKQVFGEVFGNVTVVPGPAELRVTGYAPTVRVDPKIVDDVIEKKGLRQISDSGEIEKLVDEVLAANAKQVQDYRAGKEKAFNSLVGQVMKATRGKANPAQVNELLKKKLS
jgi:aspartyl-tRNA(Asn)/glutamyl-tRNA(Gln) amidotransferase subunit B